MDDVRAARLRRLHWHSRRALLELDLMFQRYWDRVGDGIDSADEAALQQLLAMEDHDLWELVSTRQQTPDPGLNAMLGLLRQP